MIENTLIRSCKRIFFSHNIFLKILKVQQKTIKIVFQLHFSKISKKLEDLSIITVNSKKFCNIFFWYLGFPECTDDVSCFQSLPPEITLVFLTFFCSGEIQGITHVTHLLTAWLHTRPLEVFLFGADSRKAVQRIVPGICSSRGLSFVAEQG